MAANNFKNVVTKYFKPGATVEISSEDDGFRGSWYQGTVIKKAKKDKVLVEYKDLLEDDEVQRLRDEVDAVQLRPIPPRESPNRSFTLNEDVDCLYNDGWWEGVITEVLEDGRYSVYFRATREQMEFRRSEIRLHREWLHGEWDPPLEAEAEVQNMSHPANVEPGKEAVQEKMPANVEPGKEAVQDKICQGARVEVSSDEDGFAGAWFAATVIEVRDNGKYLVEYESLRNDDDTEFLREEVDSLHIRPYPPDFAVADSFKVYEEVDALYNDGWWVGIIYEVLGDQKYNVYFRGTDEEMEFKHCDLRKHQDWIDGKWVIPSQALKLR